MLRFVLKGAGFAGARLELGRRGYQNTLSATRLWESERTVDDWKRKRRGASRERARAVANTFLRYDKYEEAVETLEVAQLHGGCTFQTIIPYGPIFRHLLEAGRNEQAIAMFTQLMSGDKLKMSCEVAKYICRACGSVEKYVELINEIGVTLTPPHIPGMLVAGLQMGCDLSPIPAQMARLGLRPSSVTYRILLWWCRLNAEEEEFGRILQAALASKDVVRDLKFYTEVIFSLSQLRDVDGALAAFESMMEEGIQPDVRVLVYLASAHGRVNDLMSLKDTYELIRTRANYLSDVHTCILAHDFSHLGDLKTVEELYLSFRQSRLPPSPNLLSVMITAYGRAGLLEKAMDVYEEGLRRNLPGVEHLHLAMINAYGKNGNIQGVEDTFRKTSRSRHAFNALIQALGENGQVDLCQGYLSRMMDRGMMPKAAQLAWLVLAYGKAGDLTSAVTTFEQTKDYAQGASRWLYKCMITAYGIAGDAAGALATFEELESRGQNPGPPVFRSLVAALGLAGDLEGAVRTHEEMLSRGWKSSIEDYHVLMKVLLDHNNVSGALELVVQLLEDGMQPTAVTFDTLVTPFVQRNDLERASMFMEQLLKAGGRPGERVYETLVKGYAREGRLEESVKAFKAMRARGAKTDDILIDRIVDQVFRHQRHLAIEQFHATLSSKEQPESTTPAVDAENRVLLNPFDA